MGAVMLGRAISQASATCAGVAFSARGDLVERLEDAQAALVEDTSSCRPPRGLLPKSASERYLPVRKPRPASSRG